MTLQDATFWRIARVPSAQFEGGGGVEEGTVRLIQLIRSPVDMGTSMATRGRLAEAAIVPGWGGTVGGRAFWEC